MSWYYIEKDARGLHDLAANTKVVMNGAKGVGRMQELTEQELVRREKAKKLERWESIRLVKKFDRDAFAKDITEKYKDVPHDDFEQMNDCYTVAGRIMFIRKMGKASFFTIQDRTGKLQVYISINDVGEEVYNLFKSADIGDIVEYTVK